MKIIVAQTAGFCMGVKRAVERTIRETFLSKNISTYGPLIHNPQTLTILKEKGVRVIDSVDAARSGSVVIRAHGVTPEVLSSLKAKKNIRVCNATCPKVANVQGTIKKYRNRGYSVVIVGDEGHAEVIGLRGYAGDDVMVIHNRDQAALIKDREKLLVISQTTFDVSLFETLALMVRVQNKDVIVKNTICDSTWKRQVEVRQMAQQSDAIVIIGGKNSANTKRLVEIASRDCPCVYAIEESRDLDAKTMCQYETIGVSSGASTPTWLINETLIFLEDASKSGRRRLLKFIGFLIKSHLFSALSAAFLAAGFSRYLGFSRPWMYGAITFLYLYAMNQVNHLLDLKVMRMVDPERYFYLSRYGALFWASYSLAVGVILGLSFWLPSHWPSFLFLAAAVGIGSIYKLDLPRIFHFQRSFTISDIPGSKDIMFSLALASVILILPLINGQGQRFSNVLFVFAFIFTLALANSFLNDLKRIHDDKIIGNETIPVIIGEQRTNVLIYTLYGVLGAAAIVGMLLGWIHIRNVYFLIILTYLTAAVILATRPGKQVDSSNIDIIGDMNFLIAGTLAYFWW